MSDAPRLVRARDVVHQVWGDRNVGEVVDAVYVASEEVHLLVFELPPGGGFRDSEAFPTVFDHDEVYRVLAGRIAVSNPDTGDVHVAGAGEAVLVRPGTRHHAFTVGAEPVRIVECIGSAATSGDPGTKKPGPSIEVVRRPDLLWRLEGDERALVAIAVSTERLTVGTVRLRPGQEAGVHAHEGAEAAFLLAGRLGVGLSANAGPAWLELDRDDGLFVPAGEPHRYVNMSGEPAELLFAVAGAYSVEPR